MTKILGGYNWAYNTAAKVFSSIVAVIGLIYGCYQLKNRKKYDCLIEICENGIRGVGYRGFGEQKRITGKIGKSRIKKVKIKRDELFIDADNPYWNDMYFYGLRKKRKIRKLIYLISNK